ncbi:MAG: tRNA epoxyqueuosine(34) reductase QueG [Alphaproteobacteria bacterium]|nr:tRNA epoxyqueuosine(34) reductase QueG [Alphaproteobacteria bacterium]
MNPGPTSAIEAEALRLGFDAVGFARPDPGDQARAGLAAFLQDGRHGTMAWLQDRALWRGDPLKMMPTARSIVMLGLSYAPEEHPDNEPEGDACISVFARGRDYHDVMKKRLKALARWMGQTYQAEAKVFVDTAPLMEKPLAARAGLGWQGKHTNLVSKRFGSWLFLGAVLTDLDLAPSQPESDHCGRCERCLKACPTGAITPYRMDARKCISYLTIESKDAIPADLAGLLGNRVFGCDACLAVCPWNKFAKPSPHPEFAPRFPVPADLDLLEKLDEEGFRQHFAQTPVRRAGYARFKESLRLVRLNERTGHGG